MATEDILITLVPSAIGLVGVYVKLVNEVTSLSSRVKSLELDRDELKQMVRECVDGIHELKVLLAKKGM